MRIKFVKVVYTLGHALKSNASGWDSHTFFNLNDMYMKKNIVNTLISGLSVLAAGTAQSFPNVGLVNTGEGIVVDNVTDFTYLLTNSSGNPIYGDYREAAIGSGWPISPWVAVH